MGKIKLLSDELINKIAAGEVVERPSSVVKEFIENSLDAKATTIRIDVEQSGKKLIRVTDNGEGMSKEDAKNAIMRHATSKIRDAQDLYSINTLGFRGEALASISAVSRFRLITKQPTNVAGYLMQCDGGIVISNGEIGAEIGTCIEVRDLFFNTPVRQKFMRTDAVELRHIAEVVSRYALLHPNISFTLYHNGNRLVSAPSVEGARDNVASVLGVEIAQDLLEVSLEKEGMNVTGFISTPYNARNDRSHQMLYVNGRWVRDKTITDAIYSGYHSMLFVGKHPMFVLHIELDPEKVDVNIHPQKSEVKFEDGNTISTFIVDAIKETLKKNSLVPEVDIQAEQQVTFGVPLVKPIVKTESKYTYEPAVQHVLQDEVVVYSGDVEPQSEIPTLTLLGQIHKTFFLAEVARGYVVVDQHAAHERVMYEQFMQQFMGKKVEIQQLLQGEVLEFTAAQCVVIKDKKELLSSLGFILEEFGGNSFVLKSIPEIFGRLQPVDLIHTVLDAVQVGETGVDGIKEQIITRMACRAAVMAGDDLTISFMKKVLCQLQDLDHPFTCPHGRPTMIRTNVLELEKKFRRC